jgi:hypothetical protein
MTAAAGLLQTLSNGWNAMTAQVSKAYTGACNLTNAGWQRLMQFEAVQKTVNFSTPYINKATDLCKRNYPEALKFQWSTGTAVATTFSLFVTGGILRILQSDLSKVKNQIAALEAKQKARLAENPPQDLNRVDQQLLLALQAKKDQLEKA